MKVARDVARLLGGIVQSALLALIRLYQLAISPVLGRHCRFEPTCSRYMAQAIRKYGVLRGVGRGLGRLGRCHPWHPGGYDPP